MLLAVGLCYASAFLLGSVERSQWLGGDKASCKQSLLTMTFRQPRRTV